MAKIEITGTELVCPSKCDDGTREVEEQAHLGDDFVMMGLLMEVLAGTADLPAVDLLFATEVDFRTHRPVYSVRRSGTRASGLTVGVAVLDSGLSTRNSRLGLEWPAWTRSRCGSSACGRRLRYWSRWDFERPCRWIWHIHWSDTAP